MKYIKGFDGLRAISVLFVLFTHLGLAAVILPDTNYFKFHVYSLFAGTTGVQIFFTLSGFLITTILLREKEATGKINIKHFFIKRALRLFPPLIIFFIILVPLILLNKVETEMIAVYYAAFYAYNYIPKEFYSQELGHTWSLAIEEQFYLIYPFLVRYITLKKFIYVCLSLGIACVGIEVLFYYLKITNHYLAEEYFIFRWFIPAALPIVVGSLLAIALQNNINAITRFLKEKKTIGLTLGIVLYCFPLISFIPLTLAKMAQPFGTAFLIGLLYCNNNNLIVKALEFKVIRYIGRISYGLYLYQGLFLGTGPKGILVVQEFPLNIFLTFVVAIISFELIERKVLTLKTKLI